MATQGFIQQIAQDNQMLSPNNGNPNTVYNRAAPAAPVQGWAANPITPAANYTGTDVAGTIAAGNANTVSNGWVAPAPNPNAPVRQPVAQLPEGWAEQIKNFDPNKVVTTPTNPTTPTTPTTPTVPNALNNNSTQWIWMGDNGAPGMNTDLYNNDPAYKKAYDETLAIHQKKYGKGYTNKSNSAVLISDLKKAYAKAQATTTPTTQTPTTGNTGGTGVVSGGGSGAQGQGWVQGSVTGGPIGLGTGKTVSADTISSVNNYIGSTDAPRNNGWNAGEGDVGTKLNTYVDSVLNGVKNSANTNSVMQMLDAITEPFLPGNLYMSELGKVNMPNALAAVLNKVVPGIGTLGKWLADKIPDGAGGILGKMRDFFREGKFQELANEIYKDYDMEKAQEAAIGNQNNSGGGGGGSGMSGGWSGGMGGWSGLGLGGGGGASTPSWKPDISIGDLQKV